MMTTLHLIATWAVDIAGVTTLFVLGLVLLCLAALRVKAWLERPYIPLGRKRAVCRFRDDEDRQRSLAFLLRGGIEGQQIGKGQWHLLRRNKDHESPPARVKLPSVPLDTNPRRGID